MNEWKFTADNKQFRGVFNVTYLSPGIGLVFEGVTAPSQDTSLLLLIGFTSSQIIKGYYNTVTLPANSLFYMSDANTRGIFDANPTTSYYGIITFQIISFDETTREVKGKFSGKVRYQDATTSVITDGAFWATVWQ